MAAIALRYAIFGPAIKKRGITNILNALLTYKKMSTSNSCSKRANTLYFVVWLKKIYLPY